LTLGVWSWKLRDLPARLLRCGARGHAYGKVSRVDETQIPEDAAFRIQLPTFEGPLDLLLHLIKKHELDILDLPIAFVTERYLDYLQMMQELDLDIASEYLLMAATLAHIKSKMLLPQNPLDEADEQDEAYVGDPRAELIRRLLEYQKYRAAADQLGSRPITGRDVFGRGIRTEEAQGPAPLAPIDLYKLLDAFGAILKRVKGRVALEVTAERITIHERITELADLLRSRRSLIFEELFAGDRTRYEVVVTFLALLEMTKLRMTRIYQSDPKAPIHVQYALLDAEAPPPTEAELSADAPAPVEPESLAADGGEPDVSSAIEAEEFEASDGSDGATLDARAWDELDAALEPAEPRQELDDAPAPSDVGFDEDAPTLTNNAPPDSEQPTSDADSTDDNRETSA
jgi:segregation and condensation protein A